ncbi:hypothetical protein ABW636_04835 [Aquimarina sp. 2201CG1-2-11]|uniref:hypothetical protein n=1 Tax=Aquimarina discodermiae TaxID=3231043 RepID=UPI00346230E7
MNDKTPQQKYIEAFTQLLRAAKELNDDISNPFNLEMPKHMGLPEETFISDSELNDLTQTLEKAAQDNMQFAKLWDLGTDIVAMAKSLHR